MLENMHRILEKIDSLNQSFKGMVPKKNRRQEPTFAAAINEAMQSPADIGLAATADTNVVKNIHTDVKALIDKYSQQFGLKPELVKQVIEVASQNNPQAVDSQGNLGLMQIKPQIFQELGGADPFDPEQNIMAGTKHLANMMQKNGDNLPLALASYNSDPATVKRFGGVPPFPSTQNFVSQVLSGLGMPDKNK